MLNNGTTLNLKKFTLRFIVVGITQNAELLTLSDIFLPFFVMLAAQKSILVGSILPLHFTNSNSNENKNKDMATTKRRSKIYVAAVVPQQGDIVILDLHSLFVLI